MPRHQRDARVAAAAAAASAQPAVVSWSVSATTSSPAAAGLGHQAAGGSVPSDADGVGVQVDAHAASA